MLLSTACNNDLDCFSNKSDEKNLSFNTEDYINFHFSDVFEVQVFQDSAKKITIEGPEYLVSKVDLKRNQSNMELSIKDPCNFLKDQKQMLTVSLFVPEIDTLKFNTLSYLSIPDTFTSALLVLQFWGKTGSSNITVNTDRIFFYSACLAGNFDFKGKTRRFTAELRKASTFNTKNLNTRFGVVHQFSANNCYITASERLIANIYNKGNVYIDSLPEITEIEYFGEGQVIVTKD